MTAEPIHEEPATEEEAAMNSNQTVGQELREAVAKALGCDPADLDPRQH